MQLKDQSSSPHRLLSAIDGWGITIDRPRQRLKSPQEGKSLPFLEPMRFPNGFQYYSEVQWREWVDCTRDGDQYRLSGSFWVGLWGLRNTELGDVVRSRLRFKEGNFQSATAESYGHLEERPYSCNFQLQKQWRYARLLQGLDQKKQKKNLNN